jgi:hypothetical protein
MVLFTIVSPPLLVMPPPPLGFDVVEFPFMLLFVISTGT